MLSRMPVAILFAMLVLGCASLLPRFEATMPAGTHFLGEVIYVASRAEIISTGVHQAFLERGVSDADIDDGSAGTVRINCCGGPDEDRNSRVFYVPPGQRIEIGDIVDIQYGSITAPSGVRRVSTLVDTRQKAGQSHQTCRWIPDCASCWSRVIYCDGLEDEGWTRWGPMEWWVRLPEGHSPEDSKTRVTY